MHDWYTPSTLIEASTSSFDWHMFYGGFAYMHDDSFFCGAWLM
jgi:hypothetical protein